MSLLTCMTMPQANKQGRPKLKAEDRLRPVRECFGVVEIKLGIFLRGPSREGRQEVEKAMVALDDAIERCICPRTILLSDIHDAKN